jgi:hypothetical protein
MILKMFSQKIGKNGVFDSKQSKIMQKFDHTEHWFSEKNANFFAENRRKL